MPFPSPGDLPDPGIELRSPALKADALPSEPPGNQKEIAVKIKNPVWKPWNHPSLLFTRVNTDFFPAALPLVCHFDNPLSPPTVLVLPLLLSLTSAAVFNALSARSITSLSPSLLGN